MNRLDNYTHKMLKDIKSSEPRYIDHLLDLVSLDMLIKIGYIYKFNHVSEDTPLEVRNYYSITTEGTIYLSDFKYRDSHF